MSFSILRNIGVLIFICCFYVISYQKLMGYRSSNEAAIQNVERWNLPPVLLEVLAGEFKGLVADMIVLEIGARLGTEIVRTSSDGIRVVKKKYNWPVVLQMFESAMVLDPYFGQTYTVAQGWLPWEPAHMVDETQKLLKIAAQNRSWDWRPYHSMGFNEYYFNKRPAEAGKFMLQAAQVPGAPPFLPILGARLAQKGGETKVAIVVLKSMLAAKDKAEPGYRRLEARLQALEGVLKIEHAIASFTKSYGRKPYSLQELLSTEELTEMPFNPEGGEYCIDNNGKVFFDYIGCSGAKP